MKLVWTVTCLLVISLSRQILDVNLHCRVKATLCSNCSKEGGTLSKCSACKRASYCSKECQKQHWNEHKKTCKKYSS